MRKKILHLSSLLVCGFAFAGPFPLDDRNYGNLVVDQSANINGRYFEFINFGTMTIETDQYAPVNIVGDQVDFTNNNNFYVDTKLQHLHVQFANINNDGLIHITRNGNLNCELAGNVLTNTGTLMIDTDSLSVNERPDLSITSGSNSGIITVANYAVFQSDSNFTNSNVMATSGMSYSYFGGTFSNSNNAHLIVAGNSKFQSAGKFQNSGTARLTISEGGNFYGGWQGVNNSGSAIIEIEGTGRMQLDGDTLTNSENAKVNLKDNSVLESLYHINNSSEINAKDTSLIYVKGFTTSPGSFINQFNGRVNLSGEAELLVNDYLENKNGALIDISDDAKVTVKGEFINNGRIDFHATDHSAGMLVLQDTDLVQFRSESELNLYLDDSLRDAAYGYSFTFISVTGSTIIDEDLEIFVMYEDGSAASGWTTQFVENVGYVARFNIPEPAELASLFGLISLGFILYRKRRR